MHHVQTQYYTINIAGNIILATDYFANKLSTKLALVHLLEAILVKFPEKILISLNKIANLFYLPAGSVLTRGDNTIIDVHYKVILVT